MIATSNFAISRWVNKVNQKNEKFYYIFSQQFLVRLHLTFEILFFLPACSTNGSKHSKLEAIPKTLVTAAFPATEQVQRCNIFIRFKMISCYMLWSGFVC